MNEGRSAQPVPRGLSPGVVSYVKFCSGTTVPTSWTTAYTVPARKQAIVDWFSFYATDTDATYLIKVRITTAQGVSSIIGQGKPSAAGYLYQLVEADQQTLIAEAGSTLDIIGSGAGAIAINYYACGRLIGLPG